jgi:hypothetical protein
MAWHGCGWRSILPTASQGLAHRAGYQLERRLPRHCGAWLADDPDRDKWHDCLIFAHTPEGPRAPQALLLLGTRAP